MELMLVCVGAILVLIFGWITFRRRRTRQEIATRSVEPDELHMLLNSKLVQLYDVRQPLDFLAHPEIIRGAIRIAPKDIAEQTMSFSRDLDAVIYCTGGDHDTSKMVLGKARALKFTRVKILRGGLDAWKAKGYPVEAYTDPFQLDTQT